MEKAGTALIYPLAYLAMISIGICFCLAIVLSLIPIYIATNPGRSSSSGFTGKMTQPRRDEQLIEQYLIIGVVYELNNVRFSFGSDSPEDVFIARRQVSSVRPTSHTVTQLEKRVCPCYEMNESGDHA